jgi:hypothetical protein
MMTNTPDAATPPLDNTTKVNPSPAGSHHGDGNHFGRQVIRLAVVLNGGVSLAI